MPENTPEVFPPVVFPFDSTNPKELISKIKECNKKITEEQIRSERTFKYLLKYFNQ